MPFRSFLILSCFIAIIGCGGGGGAKQLSEAERKEEEAKMAKQVQSMNAQLPAKLPKSGPPNAGNPATPAAPK